MPGKVRNFVTLGTPHMGVDAFPYCTSGTACDLLNVLIKKIAYMDWV